MAHRTLFALALAAALGLPAAALGDQNHRDGGSGRPQAAATTTTVAPDPEARSVTALDGTVVWVTGPDAGPQRLMVKDAAGIRPVPGAPAARAYRSLDLGRDEANLLVLTYLRCSTPSVCVVRRDDLDGRRRSIALARLPGCEPTTAPAMWRSRMAYGLSCRDDSRSGLYVRSPLERPRRIPRPPDAAKFGVREVASVDLRGTRIAAVLRGVYSYAYSADTDGTDVRSVFAGASEGESDEQVTGLALAPGGTQWSLTVAIHTGDPPATVLHRLDRENCRATQVLEGTIDTQERFPAIDLAVDAGRLLLVVPGTGIVEHAFTPERACP